VVLNGEQAQRRIRGAIQIEQGQVGVSCEPQATGEGGLGLDTLGFKCAHAAAQRFTVKLDQAGLCAQVPYRPLGVRRSSLGEDLHGKTRFPEAGHHRGQAVHVSQPQAEAGSVAKGAGQPVREAGRVAHLADHVEVARRHVQLQWKGAGEHGAGAL